MRHFLVQAFTWNGFEDGTTWLGGLWSGKTSQQGDFATIVYRAQLYGFNAVRIPFRYSPHPKSDLKILIIAPDLGLVGAHVAIQS